MTWPRINPTVAHYSSTVLLQSFMYIRNVQNNLVKCIIKIYDQIFIPIKNENRSLSKGEEIKLSNSF